MMGPRARLRIGLRAALRRRFGYAALRVLRRAAVRAFVDDLERSIGDRPYVTVADQLRADYWAALNRLRKRWPNLDPSDPRSDP